MKDLLRDFGKEHIGADKEIIDAFFNKSSKGKIKGPKKRKKLPGFIFRFLLIAALVLFSFFSILYISKISTHNKKLYEPSSFYQARDIIKNGQINRIAVGEVYFDGDAKEGSSFLNNSIKLVNAGEYGHAALVVRFREVIDLKEKNILILGRAERGTKKISVALKDSKNRIMEERDMSLVSDWTLRHLFVGKKYDFDPAGVKELKIEFGSHTAGNEKGSVIFIKDITVRGVL